MYNEYVQETCSNADSKFDLPEFQVGDLLWCMMLFEVYTIVIPLHQKADDTFLCL